jgi:hypothetical protein
VDQNAKKRLSAGGATALVQFGFFHSHRGFSPVVGKSSATQQRHT